MSDPPPDFEAATSVEATGEPGRFRATLSEDWCVVGKPNGGYLAATMARAAVAGAAQAGGGQAEAIAVTSVFLGAPDPGPAEIEVEPLRIGRGVSQLRSILRQEGRALVESQLVLSDLLPGSRIYDGLPAPAATAPEDCPRAPAGEGPREHRIAIMEGTDVRMDPITAIFDQGFDEGEAEVRGWASFADGRPVDGLALHYLIDCLPPATFRLRREGWVPTLQLTSYLRALPAPGPVLIRQRAQVIDSGLVDEVCEIWDSAGTLVAQGTQLAKVRFG